MSHAISLRVIGQSLETAKLPAFQLDMDGADYILTSDSLTKTVEWILRHALAPHDFSEYGPRQSSGSRSVRFTATDISRLDEQARKQRNNPSISQQTFNRLSQMLRALGDHLDQSRVSTSHISWTPASVSVDFKSRDGQSDSRTFSPQKLEELGKHLRFRRSRTPRHGFAIPKRLTDH
jgi:hypothetical protein